ncbi:hypothetical protein [Allosalinactinospora lopnorensis]|uniref:hypothetical protein n=1 Tax=Allosalinactinospora lopnorensis TaxID=1352348 RepID=UPI000623CC6C|nr:hypothetical protein [Allosalinactinospora lopnorensis]
MCDYIADNGVHQEPDRKVATGGYKVELIDGTDVVAGVVATRSACSLVHSMLLRFGEIRPGTRTTRELDALPELADGHPVP